MKCAGVLFCFELTVPHPRIVPRVDLDLNRHHIVSDKLKPMLLKANLSGEDTATTEDSIGIQSPNDIEINYS